jgi:hypothetical protein
LQIDPWSNARVLSRHRVVQGPIGRYPPAMHACVPNIGAGQQRRRLILGGASLAAAVALALALAAFGAALPLRATVLLPLFSAALGFFQFREKT